MNAENSIRLALPGKGTLESTTLEFLAGCGMKVNRSNPRQYLARLKSIPEVEVVFQRAADIPTLVQDGDATLGITGYDVLMEHRGNGDSEGENSDDQDLVVLARDLGYGGCRLVLAVPETWIDVSTCADLWHLSGYYRTHKGRSLRIATKYPALTGQFLRRHGIMHYKIVSPHGALEAAPLTDTADLIVDLTETGTTLRENRLKLLDDGVVLRSQACLVANASLLRRHEEALRLTSVMLQLIDARMQAHNHAQLTAHIRAQSPEALHSLAVQLEPLMTEVEVHYGAVFERIHRASISDLSGDIADNPSVHEHSGSGSSTISGVVRIGDAITELLETVAVLRRAGATHINITPLTYRFTEESTSVRALHKRLT